MRILYICRSFGYQFGGNEKFALALSQAVADSGHEVYRMSWDCGDCADYHLYNNKLSKFRMLWQALVPQREIVQNVLRIIKICKPDIIQHHHKDPHMVSTGRALAIARRRWGIPWIGAVRGMGFLGCVHSGRMHVKYNGQLCEGMRQRCCFQCAGGGMHGVVRSIITWAIQERGYRAVFLGANAMTANSYFSKRRLLQWSPKSQIEVIGNFSPYEENKHELKKYYSITKNILYVGRVSREKGLEWLLRSMPRILQAIPGASLDVAGVGEDLYRCKQLSVCLNIRNRVTFHGHIVGKDLARLFREAIVVVMPNEWLEAFGGVAVEAMSFSKPLIVTDRGGPREIVIQGKTGFVIPAMNYIILANKIIYLLSNPDFATRMGEEGRMRLERKYSKQECVSGYIKLYKQVLLNSK